MENLICAPAPSPIFRGALVSWLLALHRMWGLLCERSYNQQCRLCR